MQGMWKAKPEAIQVMTGYNSDSTWATEMKSIKSKELQKTAALGTTHVLRKVLMSKYKAYVACDIILHTANIVTTEQLQHYIIP
jgi:hypothetical protein